MPTEHSLILDITTVLVATALGGFFAHRLRQPVILGYLVSGFAIGPFGFKLLSNVNEIKSLAEIGVAFLLFALGVEFSLAELRRVKEIAIKGSLLQIGLTIALVTIVTLLTGWASSITKGIFLGAVLSLSSTAIVLKTLTEKGEVNTVHGQIMLAILIAQDLALGVMLAIIPALQQPENIAVALSLALVKITIFVGVAIIFSRWVVPRVLSNIAATESNELFLLVVIALCLGVAVITANLGLSIAMGAFVAGLMISEIDYADQALAKILPLRDTFASLFFASIGMLIDPAILISNFAIILELVALVMLGKAVIIFGIVLKFGYSLKNAIIVSLGINQIGEFSFVLALVGLQLELISQQTYSLLLGTTAITLILTPFSLKVAPFIADNLNQNPVLANFLQRFSAPKTISMPEIMTDHVVVAGYGRVGQVVVNILQTEGYPVLVIENSEASVQRLRMRQIPYIFGDADSELVLEKAHLATAKALAIALPDAASTRLLLKNALTIAPHLDVIARSHNNKEIDILTQMGAKEVVQPEFEAALELGNHLLKTLGAAESYIQTVINTIRKDRYLSVRPDQE
ncbi:cation:proton antiporter [Sphaerospermopsis kisseleviana CS-549]|jgi:CPA2 family monovalent cation:H+ antiporter-2|uniref:Cation:proton antiporter n=1 Tax=Sphaerospermopsis kisseleviana CS-549 TaxID=3021783 RepID=A0ABT4ZVU0_9CYAN|nr:MULTISPECIES: cation:proton antiporter [Sphaerospermopsis]MBD2134968.1 cation:proton antiporter [Sphaerospermopsis sp. FACHB-1094]MDB9443517.1 cation:proton antiporter [Sphaerospermopsis kisseleviana CS-549]BAZ80666.1 putative potassium efflux transporter [Sphaerospermopsis kisseleviana NIES-73]